MLSKKRITLNKLISYVLSFSSNTVNDNVLDTVFTSQIKSNDEFKFEHLKCGETKNINDFPNKLRSLLEPFIKELNRNGIRSTFDNDINMSLYSSILSLMINDFDNLPAKEQFNCITKLRDKIIIHMTNKDIMKNNGYSEFGWIKTDITNSLIQYKTNKIILKLFADYFNINIFLLNIMEDRIYVISDANYYNLFRPNVFLVLNNDTFEPLVYNGNKIIDHGSSLIKKLITVDKNFLIMMEFDFNINKKVPFVVKFENLDKYIKKENATKNPKMDEIENGYSEIMQTDSDTFYDIKDIEKTNDLVNVEQPMLVFKLSSKMKLEEIQDIAKKLNIILEKDGKNKKVSKTKGELINEINSLNN